MYIFNHFDNAQDLALDEIELRYAKQSILSALPDLNWDVVIPQITHR